MAERRGGADGRASIGSSPSIGVLAGALVAIAPGCTDHAYSHDVRGRVVDASDRPVASAIVARVKDPASRAVFGHAELYERATAPDGSFVFTHEGLGGEPPASHTWHLRAEAPGCDPGSATLTVPLVGGTYVARDVLLRVRCDPGAPSR